MDSFLFKALVDRGESLKDFKSFARTTVSTNDFRRSIKQAIVIRGYDSIRIDVLSLFNKPIGAFIQLKDQIVLFDLHENKYYADEEALILIKRFLGMELNFNEFIPIISANIPFLGQLTPVNAWISENGSMYKILLRLIDSKLGFAVQIDSETRIPRKISKLLENEELYSVTWKNFKKINGYSLPHLLEWSSKKSNKSLILKLNNPVPNTGIKDSAFNLNIPVN
mgnify:CR=1 FL=1